jgi:maltooligosyltrehalose trehalohydrolase
MVLEEGSGSQSIRLLPEKDGYVAGFVRVGAGVRYRFRLDQQSELYSDPASRFQPEGPLGPSEIVDPSVFGWTDEDWTGSGRDGQVLYEMHIGTFTPAGTWAAAAEQLAELAGLGITTLEVMPVADFGGRFGWGYDGVNLFAPSRLYGRPDDMRRFVDRAHALGLGVILDVVYNHIGPVGNFLKQFAASYFTDRYRNDWGEAINFDGPDAGPVREYFLSNAAYWVEEYHIDGFRLDATQQIYDGSRDNIMAALVERVQRAAHGRKTLVVAENEPQSARLARPRERGGYGIDALWNDDFHHTAHVALSGHNEAYFTDYRGSAQELLSACKWGFLYQGQYYSWQKQRRGGGGLDLEPAQFINYLQNHDQVANSCDGRRCHELTSPGRLRAMTALLLLAPGTPMLFQGQEFASSSRFLYFADHDGDLALTVARGRKEFLAQFPSIALPEVQASLSDPADPDTFVRCRLDFRERQQHAPIYRLHKDLLRLRREDPVFGAPRRRGVDGAVLSPQAFLLRFFGADEPDRILLVNLGSDLHLNPAPEPLLAPPEGQSWAIYWSSEDLHYGGGGTPALETLDNWRIPGEAAVVLKPVELA